MPSSLTRQLSASTRMYPAFSYRRPGAEDESWNLQQVEQWQQQQLAGHNEAPRNLQHQAEHQQQQNMKAGVWERHVDRCRHDGRRHRAVHRTLWQALAAIPKCTLLALPTQVIRSPGLAEPHRRWRNICVCVEPHTTHESCSAACRMWWPMPWPREPSATAMLHR